MLTTDTAYKLTREQSKNWIRFAVVREYPMGMPWEGIEEKSKSKGLPAPAWPTDFMSIGQTTTV